MQDAGGSSACESARAAGGRSSTWRCRWIRPAGVPPDYAASLTVVERVRAREETIAGATAVRLRVRGLGPRQVLHVTLMEDDGTSWSSAVTVDSDWSERTLPLERFAVARGVKLPQGFPGEWNYWVGPAEGRGGRGDRPRLEHLERLQLSLRREGAERRTRGVRGGGRVGQTGLRGR